MTATAYNATRIPGNPDTVWVDLETSGLDSVMDHLMEVGVIVLDKDFNEIATFRQVVCSAPVQFLIDRMPSKVLEMHTKNGLLDELRNIWAQGQEVTKDLNLISTNRRLRDFLDGIGPAKKFEMCGSTINFDRGFLNEDLSDVHDWFHYRNIDVSTIKNVCRRVAPELYATVPQVPVEDKKHRVLDDIRASITEYRYYLDHLMVGR